MSDDRSTDKLPTFEKGMALLGLIIRDGGRSLLRELASELNIPLSTAYRVVGEQIRAGWLSNAGRGHYAPGQVLLDLTSSIQRGKVLVQVSQPHLKRLARQLHHTVHLGVLENEMVTYLVKEHGGKTPVFTQAGMQLEAYCSAIGKMLLASLSDPELDAYMAGEPFVPLTPRTIVDPGELRTALSDIRRVDYAIDDEEVVEGLQCIATPVRNRHGKVVAAISLSQAMGSNKLTEDITLLDAIRDCADKIARCL